MLGGWGWGWDGPINIESMHGRLDGWPGGPQWENSIIAFAIEVVARFFEYDYNLLSFFFNIPQFMIPPPLPLTIIVTMLDTLLGFIPIVINSERQMLRSIGLTDEV